MPAVKAYYDILVYLASISRAADTYHLVTTYLASNYLPIGYADTTWCPGDQAGAGGRGPGGSPRRENLFCSCSAPVLAFCKVSALSAKFCLT